MKRIATYLLCGITLFAAVSCANDDEIVNESAEDNLGSVLKPSCKPILLST